MMKTLLTTIFSIIILAANAQTFEPNVFSFNSTSGEDVQIGWSMTNDTGEELNFNWEATLAEDWPQEWQIQVCDIELCYAPGALRNSTARTNSLPAGESTNPNTTYVKVITNGVAGISSVELCFFDNNDFEDPFLCTELASSTEDVFDEDYRIFPNPTTERFQLSNDSNIKQISIYNIVGRLERTENHSEGMTHDVSDLRSGIYLVRLMDAQGNVKKAMRLSKR